MTAVKSSDFQKNVGMWLDKLHEGPVQITRYERPAGVLISASHYQELLSNYRKIIPAGDLSDQEVEMIRHAKVMTDRPFTLGDLPEVEPREAAKVSS